MNKVSNSVMKCQRYKKTEVVERFGGKCQKCGYNKCINALEFHHLAGKKESPSYIIMRWSWERAKKELDKCVMLCANCHREAHYLDRDIMVNFETPQWQTHICPTCHKSYDTRNEEQVYCSNRCKTDSWQTDAKPTKEKLHHLIRHHSFAMTGRMFSVSPTTIRRWCRNFGISLSEAKGYRQNPETIRIRQEQTNCKKCPPIARRRLTLDEARAALQAMRAGQMSIRSIAKQYRVCHSVFFDIKKGRSYQELAPEFPDLITLRA